MCIVLSRVLLFLWNQQQKMEDSTSVVVSCLEASGAITTAGSCSFLLACQLPYSDKISRTPHAELESSCWLVVLPQYVPAGIHFHGHPPAPLRLRAHPPSLRLALASPTRAKTPPPRMVFSKAWFASKVRGFVGDSQMDEEMFKRTFVCCLLVYFISLVVRGFIRAAGAKRTRVGAGTVAELRNR